MYCQCKGPATLARLRNDVVTFRSSAMDFNIATIVSWLIVRKSLRNRVLKSGPCLNRKWRTTKSFDC